MNMTRLCKIFCGVILLTVPAVQYGGYFLLTVLSGTDGNELTEFQRSMFRAGHAHAGVLVLFSLIAQLLIDGAKLSMSICLALRIAFPLAAILVSGGFFAAAIGSGVMEPTSLVVILYAGIAVLAAAVITLGIGLLRSKGNGTDLQQEL